MRMTIMFVLVLVMFSASLCQGKKKDVLGLFEAKLVPSATEWSPLYANGKGVRTTRPGLLPYERYLTAIGSGGEGVWRGEEGGLLWSHFVRAKRTNLHLP